MSILIFVGTAMLESPFVDTMKVADTSDSSDRPSSAALMACVTVTRIDCSSRKGQLPPDGRKTASVPLEPANIPASISTGTASPETASPDTGSTTTLPVKVNSSTDLLNWTIRAVLFLRGSNDGLSIAAVSGIVVGGGGGGLLQLSGSSSHGVGGTPEPEPPHAGIATTAAANTNKKMCEATEGQNLIGRV